MQPIELLVKYTDVDATNAAKEYLLRKRGQTAILVLRYFIWVSAMFIAAAMIFGSCIFPPATFFENMYQSLSNPEKLGFFIFTISITTIAILIRIYLSTMQLAKRTFQQTWELQLERKFCFFEDKVEVTADQLFLRTSWLRYCNAAETPNYYLLFLNEGHYVMVPKRVFANEEQKTNFAALLKTKGLLK